MIYQKKILLKSVEQMRKSKRPRRFVKFLFFFLFDIFFIVNPPRVFATRGITYSNSIVIGGSGIDGTTRNYYDSNGNTFIYGYFSATNDLNPTSGTDFHTAVGGFDIFLTKLDSGGNFLWAKTWGSSGNDISGGLTFDSTGNIYLTGEYSGTTDFDPGVAVISKATAGSTDAFVLKLNSSGEYVWVDTFGSTGHDRGSQILVSGTDLYIGGRFQNTVDFDPGAGTTNLASTGGYDIYFGKYTLNGNLVWINKIGSSSYDYLDEILMTHAGNLLLVGDFYNTVDFDPGADATNKTSTGNYDFFFAQYNTSGGFISVKTIGSTGEDRGIGATLDADDNLYIACLFSNTVDFDPGAEATNKTSNGNYDACLAKYNSAGEFQWVRSWGGTGSDQAFSVVLDTFNNVYVIGIISETVDLDPSDTGVTSYTSQGNTDIFVSQFDSTGNFGWSLAFGGTGMDYIEDIVLSDNKLITTGYFSNTTDLDPTSGINNFTSAGNTDIFVSYYTLDVVGQTLSNISSSTDDSSSSTSTSVCSDQAPGVKPPWLYGAIAQDSESILLYFTEADNPVDKYVLEYGTKSGNYIYGAQDMGVNSRSQMTYLVRSLSPNTIYYFKVRAGNGCATGPWSNEISAKTKDLVSFNQPRTTQSELETQLVAEIPLEQKTTEEIQQSYNVNVKVIDTKKKPVEGATVTLHSNSQTIKTDKNGIASFNNVEEGNHKVLIAYNNFEGEQSINLAGDVKEFDINVTIQKKTISLSPLTYGIIGIMGLVIIGLIFKFTCIFELISFQFLNPRGL
ncbi:MAG: hypothetical protein A2378_01820 [Candidatus Pacebacteria bacterium RIFOXYB1_FULL_44_10]|nr:MAG: hypothetical protein A2378_01820 [Candidatus Pacebacteria bacterium RIFOXYB1_FULL_44_10]